MHNIAMKNKNNVPENDLWHHFYLLLGGLCHNHQIIRRELHPYLQGQQMAATVCTVTTEALAAKYFDRQVQDCITNLEDLCGAKLAITYLGNSEDEATSICTCTQQPYYVLYGFGQFYPLLCGGCGLEVPLFRLWQLRDAKFWLLANWEKNYRACVTLDIGSTVGERWAIKQQSDYNSALSHQGREVAAKITDLTGVTTYYFLTNFARRSPAKDQSRPCPSCGGAWHIPARIRHFRQQCDRCLLVSCYSSRC
jgi:predicted  nucleic acid-binding Zn ribbon protein